MKSMEIQKNIETCLRDLKNSKFPSEFRAQLIAELQAHISMMQSTQNHALVFWTKVLAGVTFVYAAVAAVDIYFSHLAK